MPGDAGDPAAPSALDPNAEARLRFGLPRWLFVGAMVGIAFYAVLLLLALLDPNPGGLSAVLVAPVLVLLTVPIAMRIARAEGDPGIVALLLIAVVLKLAAALIRNYVGETVYGGVADATVYDRIGALFAPEFRSMHFDVATSKIPGTGFIEIVIGVVYVFTGASKIAGYFVFAWMAFLGQVLFWRAFRLAIPTGNSRRYALLILLVPTLLYWPSSIGKEAWILLTMGLTSYGVVRLLKRRPLGVLLTFVGLAGVTMVRPHISLLILASLFTALLVVRSEARSVLEPVGRILMIMVVVGLAVVVLSQAETFIGVESLDQESVEATLSRTATTTGQGGSAFTPVRVSTPLDLPLATVTVLFRPWPFEADNPQMLLTSLECAFLLTVCIVSWRRFAAIPRMIRSYPYIAYSLAFLLLFVWAFSSFGNFGILARQRTQVLPFLFVLLSLPPALPRSVRAAHAAAAQPEGSPRRFDRWTRRSLPGYR